MRTFFTSPAHWKPRKWLFWIHLYTGLAVGLLALVVGLSGAALVYLPEIEGTAHQATAPVARAMPLGELARGVLEHYPGFEIEDVRFNTAGDVVELQIQKAERGKGKQKARLPGTDLRLAVDPETGAVVQVIDRRAGVWGFLRDLHHNLLAGKTGRMVNGIGALALLLLCMTGAVIWWPGPRLWKQRAMIQRGTTWKRFNWDLHHAGGFWLAVGLAFFAFTGVEYGFPEATRGVLYSVTGGAARAKKPHGTVEKGRQADLALVVKQAQAAVPDGHIARIRMPEKASEPFEVRMKTAFDGREQGNNKVFVDRATGEVILVDRFDRLSLASRAIDLLGPLHNARFMTLNQMSVVLRLPWILFGLAPGMFFITGFLMWWNRVVSKKWTALLQPAADMPARTGRARQWVRVAGIAAAMLLAARWIWAE